MEDRDDQSLTLFRFLDKVCNGAMTALSPSDRKIGVCCLLLTSPVKLTDVTEGEINAHTFGAYQ